MVKWRPRLQPQRAHLPSTAALRRHADRPQPADGAGDEPRLHLHRSLPDRQRPGPLLARVPAAGAADPQPLGGRRPGAVPRLRIDRARGPEQGVQGFAALHADDRAADGRRAGGARGAVHPGAVRRPVGGLGSRDAGADALRAGSRDLDSRRHRLQGDRPGRHPARRRRARGDPAVRRDLDLRERRHRRGRRLHGRRDGRWWR